MQHGSRQGFQIGCCTKAAPDWRAYRNGESGAGGEDLTMSWICYDPACSSLSHRRCIQEWTRPKLNCCRQIAPGKASSPGHEFSTRCPRAVQNPTRTNQM